MYGSPRPCGCEHPTRAVIGSHMITCNVLAPLHGISPTKGLNIHDISYTGTGSNTANTLIPHPSQHSISSYAASFIANFSYPRNFMHRWVQFDTVHQNPFAFGSIYSFVESSLARTSLLSFRGMGTAGEMAEKGRVRVDALRLELTAGNIIPQKSKP